MDEIEKYDRKSKLSLEQLIQGYPEIIREVASTVIAIPPTQVSVERLFSVLKIIKSDLRASMKEDIAEAEVTMNRKPTPLKATSIGHLEKDIWFWLEIL